MHILELVVVLADKTSFEAAAGSAAIAPARLYFFRKFHVSVATRGSGTWCPPTIVSMAVCSGVL